MTRHYNKIAACSNMSSFHVYFSDCVSVLEFNYILTRLLHSNLQYFAETTADSYIILIIVLGKIFTSNVAQHEQFILALFVYLVMHYPICERPWHRRQCIPILVAYTCNNTTSYYRKYRTYSYAFELYLSYLNLACPPVSANYTFPTLNASIYKTIYLLLHRR